MKRELTSAQRTAIGAYVVAVRDYIHLEKVGDEATRKAQAAVMFAAYRALDTREARVAAYERLNDGWRAP
ncbi:MAG: hypothetical protein ABR581_04785 [Thermoleophilaceae bacterium]